MGSVPSRNISTAEQNRGIVGKKEETRTETEGATLAGGADIRGKKLPEEGDYVFGKSRHHSAGEDKDLGKTF